jgi:hypothetical protein
MHLRCPGWKANANDESPSLTNYLEVVGGSNFGVRSDNPPDWHNERCKTNLQTGLANADQDAPAPFKVDTALVVCPIKGTGTDAETPAVDTWNETSPPVFNFLAEIDGVKSVPASKNISGKTIADQLAERGMSLEGIFGLPCLNHACDAGVEVMSDLF